MEKGFKELSNEEADRTLFAFTAQNGQNFKYDNVHSNASCLRTVYHIKILLVDSC